MAAPGSKGIRFQERAELLDFLLEVSAITSETLDLDRILANIASIVKEVIPYDLFAIGIHARCLQIDHAHQPASHNHGNGQFRTNRVQRGEIASVVLDIAYQDGLAGGGGHSRDAFAERNYQITDHFVAMPDAVANA